MSNFMASQEARLSKFEADFKQQQNEVTNKIDTLLKVLNNRVLNASTSKPTKNTNTGNEVQDPSSSKHVHFINTITLLPPLRNDKEEEHEALLRNTSSIKEEIMKVESENGEEFGVDYFDKLPQKMN